MMMLAEMRGMPCMLHLQGGVGDHCCVSQLLGHTIDYCQSFWVAAADDAVTLPADSDERSNLTVLMIEGAPSSIEAAY
jgi:hypothetical protein